jgi:hypothetical protein
MAVKLRRVESQNDAIRIFNFTDRYKVRSNVTRLQTTHSKWLLVLNESNGYGTQRNLTVFLSGLLVLKHSTC